MKWTKLLVILLQILTTFAIPFGQKLPSRVKYPADCGRTPFNSNVNIYGGSEIRPDEYTWMASLQYERNPTFGHCAGSVINTLYVLTAAHCVDGMRVTGVRLGDFSRSPICDYGSEACQYYQHFGIIEKIVHEDYDSKKYRNDIALLKLDRTIDFGRSVQPICLPSGRNLTDKDLVTISGWGLTEVEADRPKKRAVTISLWNQTTCLLDPDADANQICAGNPRKSSCSGDSGGPVMHHFSFKRMALEGIISRGRECGSTMFASYFTNVRSYLDWIDSHLCMD